MQSSVRTAALTLTLIFVLGAATASDSKKAVYIKDDSDWWSNLRASFEWPNINPRKLKTPAANFEILGVKLGQNQFDELADKLGEAPVVQRGDASTGRAQVCHVSDSSDAVYLVFEAGEVEESFYLFRDGQQWNGRDLCIKSNQISNRLSTGSGLQLGQTPSSVRKILGPPTHVQKNRFVYFCVTRERTPAQTLNDWRKEHPAMTDEEFHRNYDFFDVTVLVDARFVDSKLNYLAVSRAETY